MNLLERLLLQITWLIFFASICSAAFNFVVHPFDPYPKEDPTFLVIDDQGNSHVNIDFTSESYRAPARFQRKLCNVILLAFLFSSKILILVNLRNGRVRAWLYLVVILCSFLWVWLRLVNWTFFITETVLSKVIGDPLIFVVIPTIFFIRDNSKPTPPGISFQMMRLPVELLLIIPWYITWGVLQLFVLGWIWI